MSKKQKNAQPSVVGASVKAKADKAGLFTAQRIPLLILALVSFILYANTFSNGYTYDDVTVVEHNTMVTSGISSIPEILSTPYRWGFDTTRNDFYRPLSKVTFAIECQLFNESPTASHVVNVLVFAACVILLFLFFDAVFEKKKTALAFIASLLFALHPIHTEVVANIKSRDELLCFFFAIWSAIVFIKYMDTGKIKLLAGACFLYFLSLLSKESSISFLVVFPLLFFCYRNENRKRSLYITLGAIAIAGLFLLIRLLVLKAHNADHTFGVDFTENSLAGAPTFASRIATAIFMLAVYLKLLFIPYPLICDYSFKEIPFMDFSDFMVLLAIAIYGFLIILSIYRLVKYKKDPLALGILFFLITIALFSNILFLTGATMAERFLFFASAGFCLAIAYFIDKWVLAPSHNELIFALRDKKLLAILIPVSLIFATLTILRNPEWVDNITLFGADVKKAPDCARLNYSYGKELLLNANTLDVDSLTRTDLIKKSVHYLEKATTIFPNFFTHKALSDAYFFNGQLDSTEFHLKQAIALKPGDKDCYTNLEGLYYHTQRYAEAIDACKKLLEITPGNMDKYNELCASYTQLKKYDSAIYFLRKGLLMKPDFFLFYEGLAVNYKFVSQQDSALKYQAIAQRYDRNFKAY